MTTDEILAQLTNHPRVVALDVLMGELAQQLQAAVIERARLTGNKNYLGFRVSLHKGQLVVSSTPDAIALMPPPPKALPAMKVIEVKPVVVPTHIALLTGTVARFEAARQQAEREQVLETI